MALTARQIEHARYHGSQDIKNRKAALARAATVIENMSLDCAGRDSTLADKLTPAELDTLVRAATIVAKMTRMLAKDIQEADRISKQYETRKSEAMKAIYARIEKTPANVVAMAALAGASNMADLQRAIRHGAHIDLAWDYREAAGWIAHGYAKEADPLDAWMDRLIGKIGAERGRQAETIAALNAAMVAARLQQAAA